MLFKSIDEERLAVYTNEKVILNKILREYKFVTSWYDARILHSLLYSHVHDCLTTCNSDRYTCTLTDRCPIPTIRGVRSVLK